MEENIKISIVSPVYRSEELVDKLIERIIKAISQITDSFEIILVEDCGPDNAWKKIQENCAKYDYVKGIRLSRNFGQQFALQAGLDNAKGEFVVTLDCDLQDKPEEIIKLYNKALEGYDIVAAQRENRKDSWLKKILSKVFYDVLSYLTETKQDNTIANFMLYRKNAVNAMKSMKDKTRYYPMMMQWVGFNYTKVYVEHAAREIGPSSYSLKKRLDLAISIILSFSDKPLRLTVKLGAFLAFLSFIAAFALIINYFLTDITVPGWGSLAVLISFFSGIIITVLGMVGLYVGKIFETVKDRPSYIIGTIINE